MIRDFWVVVFLSARGLSLSLWIVFAPPPLCTGCVVFMGLGRRIGLSGLGFGLGRKRGEEVG